MLINGRDLAIVHHSLQAAMEAAINSEENKLPLQALNHWQQVELRAKSSVPLVGSDDARLLKDIGGVASFKARKILAIINE